MKILLAVSSSGGHITPAVALAEYIQREMPRAQIVWAYQETRTAERFLKGLGGRRLGIRKVSLPFGLSWRWLGVPAKLAALAIAARRIIARERPDLVVGFGGSAAYFLVLFATRFGIPCLIHEQNALPGRANRRLGRRVERVLAGFKECLDHFPNGRAVWTGNPVRASLRLSSRAESRTALGLDPGRLTFLVMGGSQGARRLNRLFFQVIPKWQGQDAPQWVHVTGSTDYAEALRVYQQLSGRVACVEFTERPERLYSAADLAVSRAGALTLTELAHFGIGALLVPYPFGGNHQSWNARVFAQAGAAAIVEEDTLCAARLRRELEYFARRPELVRGMGNAARRLAVPDAAGNMWREIKTVISKHPIPNHKQPLEFKHAS